MDDGLREDKSSWLKMNFSVAIVRRITVCKREKMLDSQYNQKVVSREDTRFLNIVKESGRFQDGHDSLKLPRKDHIPNNRSVVKQRLLESKGNFRRHEKVPQHQLKGEDGKLWYIPLYDVRHPKKTSFHVGFDGLVEYMGTSRASTCKAQI